MALGPFSRRKRGLLFSLVLLFSPLLRAQVPGQNVNMVSGTKWPEGDPFLERQNEPSIAASTRNPLHLLAGANDYRSVDLPVVADSQEHGDAWLGVFKSFDGGQTWTSTLLPGCPYATTQCTDSTLKGAYQAASDPVVRAGTNGLFYYSGIAFQRDQSAGVMFVARYIDNNNKENGDPIQYLGTSIVGSGNAATFLDKPWVATDVPRAGALTCNVNGESFYGGTVYVSYAAFPIANESHAAILFSRSRDCGVTWSAPIQIANNSAANQGPTFAIDPNNGTIYLAWRQFSESAGAILVAKSTNGGVSFEAPVTVANLTAFDQATTNIETNKYPEFRTNAYPSTTVDSSGRVYVAWSDRVGPLGASGCGAEPCARIVVSTSTDGVTWSTPQLADPSPAPGHQWMPALTFTGGNLTLVYYDSRDDHMQGVLVCPIANCISTSDYIEVLQAVGSDNPASIFNTQIADTPDLMRRHTIDVRVTQSPPGATLNFSSSVQVSQYLFGSSTKTTGPKAIDQLRFNPPNLPMFDSGTEAFLGDYIDITATPAFVPVLTGTHTVWRYNSNPVTGSVAQAAWTDNRDVIPPPDQDWTKYTPPQPSPTTSVFDPSETTPPCAAKETGVRNQNIYTSHITAGVLAGSPGNNKPLNQNFERAFVVFVENSSAVLKSYRLSVPASEQPPGGYASFLSSAATGFPLSQLDVSIAPYSSISRSIFVESSAPHAQITVDITQITAPGGSPVPPGPGTQTSIQLNPDLTNPDLTNPDLTNTNQSNTDIQNNEIYNPDLTNEGQTNPDLTNPDLTNPDLTNPDLTNPDITNPDLTNNGIPNPDLTNPDLTNPDLTNSAITTPDLTNGSISDTIWTVTNDGNTAAAYTIKLLLRGLAPNGVALQLLLYKVYTTPAAQGCTVVESPVNQLIANIPNPVFSNRSDLTNPDLTNPDVTNATLSLAPGDTARIDLRTASPTRPIPFNPANSVTAVATSQTANTNSPVFVPSVGASHLTILSTMLLPSLTNSPYADMLTAARYSGGPITWSITGGKLPSGVELNPSTGVISGTPNTGGTYTFTATGTDSKNAADTDSAPVTIVVANRVTITSPAMLPSGTLGVPYSYTMTATGGYGPYTWSAFGSLPPGLTLDPNTGIISGTPTATGTFSFDVEVAAASNPNAPSYDAAEFTIFIQ